jgi:hypothetical protein
MSHYIRASFSSGDERDTSQSPALRMINPGLKLNFSSDVVDNGNRHLVVFTTSWSGHWTGLSLPKNKNQGSNYQRVKRSFVAMMLVEIFLLSRRSWGQRGNFCKDICLLILDIPQAGEHSRPALEFWLCDAEPVFWSIKQGHNTFS